MQTYILHSIDLDGTYNYFKNDSPIFIALDKIPNIWDIKHQGTYFFSALPRCSWASKHPCLSQRNTYQTRPQ